MEKVTFQKLAEFCQFQKSLEAEELPAPEFFPCVMVYEYRPDNIRPGYESRYVYFRDFRCYDRKRGTEFDTSKLLHVIEHVEKCLEMTPGDLIKKPIPKTKAWGAQFFADARCIAVYMMKINYGASWAQIGAALNRDHTTATAAYTRFLDMNKLYDEFREKAQSILRSYIPI